MLFRFVRISKNQKTGPIPVVTSQSKSCPASCPLNTRTGGKGCYAAYGNSAIHWRKLDAMTVANDKTIFDLDGLACQIKALPKGQLWRFNEAGDLPQNDKGVVDAEALQAIVKANKGRRGFTYTHYETDLDNLLPIKKANQQGFTINLSCNDVLEAVDKHKLFSLPVVTLLPVNAPNVQTVQGVRVVACPAEKSDRVQCANCGLCADSQRDYIIGFRAHGTAKKAVNKIATIQEV